MRLALAVSVSFMLLTGCASAFRSGSGFHEQGCVERALRRTTDADAIAHARDAFTLECARGGAEACSALGVMNEVGVGVPVNALAAVALYERACRAGNQRACTNLGVALAEGTGGSRDTVAGARLLERACDAGDPLACVHLASMREVGVGVSKDAVLAAQLFALACDGGEGNACLALGDIRASEGQSDGATELYRTGCVHGSADACGRLDAPAGASLAARTTPYLASR